MKVLLSLSGGLDSTTLLGYLLDCGHQVSAISFYYGSKHNQYENEAAREVAKFYEIDFSELDISQAMAGIESNLMKSGGEIPEGHYHAESMKKTVVPGRNMIFMSILAGIGASRKMEGIAIGVHAGDHAIYPDCRKEFLMPMGAAIQYGTDWQVKVVHTPFVLMEKRHVIQTGISLRNPVPFELTRTCYKDQPVACGVCGSCMERLQAFEQIGMRDPIKYTSDLELGE